MAEIILHHYAGSLFSEKIRLLLGYLALPWRSVIIPPIMPRPALMPLTGGYRRTPVMQEGADVFCDTRIIAERLAARAGRSELCAGFNVNRVAEWADSQLFRVAVAVTFQPRAVVATMKGLSETDISAFQQDRAALTQGAALVTITAPAAESHLAAYLADLDHALDGAFLFGTEPTLADFSVYHCLWLIANNSVVAPLLAGYSRVTAWRERMAAFGHGAVQELPAAEALAIGRAATPAPIRDTSTARLPDGIALGGTVSITPTDYGLIPVRGELVVASAREFAVRRRDEQAGEIVVHFPRIGFAVS
jgi:glutathione S-transferase